MEALKFGEYADPEFLHVVLDQDALPHRIFSF